MEKSVSREQRQKTTMLLWNLACELKRVKTGLVNASDGD